MRWFGGAFHQVAGRHPCVLILGAQERYLQALAQAVVVTLWYLLGIKRLGSIQSKMECEMALHPHVCCTFHDSVGF